MLVPLVAAAVLLVASPVVAWVVVGNQDSPGYRPEELSYTVRFEVSPAVAAVAGITATALLVLTVAALAVLTARGNVAAAWWHVFVPVVVAGALVGAGWRVITAGTIGANIGTGLVVFFGGPVVLALLAYAVIRVVRLHRG
ncbi:MAG TPA: hypothetical protein VHH15_11715 [Actinophytocola sp.]|nr:hypothetical protein [Actinophytocola sp.]